MGSDFTERRHLHDEEDAEDCDGIKHKLHHMHRRMDDFHLALVAIQEIHNDVKQMREILDAWSSVKGFVTTLKFLAAVIKLTAIVGGTIGVIWYFIKFGHMPPTDKG